MSDWKPIETAPKDGTRVFLSVYFKGMGVEHRIEYPILAAWKKPTPTTATIRNGDEIITVKRINPRWTVLDKSWDEPLDERYIITHWMPVPSMPKGTKP